MGDTKEVENLMQGACHTVGQRWREDRVQEQRGAGLGPAVQHHPVQRCGVLPTSHAPLNMPLSLFLLPRFGVRLWMCQSASQLAGEIKDSGGPSPEEA